MPSLSPLAVIQQCLPNTHVSTPISTHVAKRAEQEEEETTMRGVPDPSSPLISRHNLPPLLTSPAHRPGLQINTSHIWKQAHRHSPWFLLLPLYL